MARGKFDDMSIIVREQDLLTTQVNGELIAMSVARGACYGLDAIGTRIWEIIAEPRSMGDIVTALTGEFEVETATCRADVAVLLRKLHDEGLIRMNSLPVA